MPDMRLETVAHVKSPAIAEFLADDREAGKRKQKVTARLRERKTDEYRYEENRCGVVAVVRQLMMKRRQCQKYRCVPVPFTGVPV
jgi:hypothetical protein